MPYIFGKLWHLAIIWLSGKHFSASYKASDFCRQTILDFPQHLKMSHILCHASSILSSSGAWSSFLDFVCWIYNLMHCFLDLLRSKMASWLSREGAGVAGLVHVWNPLVNRACCLKKCSHYTSFFKHLLCILDMYKVSRPLI